MLIKIQYLPDGKNIEKHGDWYDIATVENVSMRAGDFQYINLGVAMELPVGYEAHLVARSSTFKKHGIFNPGGVGIIDNDYCGPEDIWHFPAYAMRDTFIPKGTRIAQFRLVPSTPPANIQIVARLTNKNRKGLGSTGL